MGFFYPHAVKHSLATAANDFIVASGAGVFVKKTLAEVKTILGLGTAAYTAATAYVTHALATAADDFLVASGSGAYVKKTLAEVKTVLGITNVEDTAHSTDAHTMTIDGVDVSAHDANTTTAHGAVSAATASKIVIRDAQGQAAFAAPAASGDALIKGTRVTTAELPAMTDEYYWVGTGTNVEERAAPTGAVIATGTYTGDDSANKTIAHGLGVTPKIVMLVTHGTSRYWFRIYDQLAEIIYMSISAAGEHSVTAMDGTNFYVGNAANYGQSANSDALTYYWVAMG